MTDAARSDYSWSLPNRRFINDGLYLLSIRSEGIDTIAVIIDTSASLPDRTLADFWTEVREIAAELQPETVIVLQVDAALQDDRRPTARWDRDLRRHGAHTLRRQRRHRHHRAFRSPAAAGQQAPVTVSRRADGAPDIEIRGGKALVRVEGWSDFHGIDQAG